jgi:AcrR family transcriptional regulator
MSKVKQTDSGDNPVPSSESGLRRGRKRDPARDATILDATLAVLAEQGYDGMTIDLVAVRANSARATVYRRWPTKAELVLEAVARLSRADVGHGELPDTGSLRGDMIAMILPLSDDGQQVRIQAMAALLSLPKDDERLAEAANHAGIGPWVEVNRVLMHRAIERGEFPAPHDLNTLAEVIPMLCLARAVQQLPITREFSLALIDAVILPALRGGP